MEEDRTGSPSICPNTADPDSRWISFLIFVFSLSLLDFHPFFSSFKPVVVSLFSLFVQLTLSLLSYLFTTCSFFFHQTGHSLYMHI